MVATSFKKAASGEYFDVLLDGRGVVGPETSAVRVFAVGDVGSPFVLVSVGELACVSEVLVMGFLMVLVAVETAGVVVL